MGAQFQKNCRANHPTPILLGTVRCYYFTSRPPSLILMTAEGWEEEKFKPRGRLTVENKKRDGGRGSEDIYVRNACH